MAGLTGTELVENRYGPLGSGGQSLTIRDKVYSISDLLACMGLNFDDSRAIDALTLPDARYLFRYYDGQDQRVVAVEFDADFRCLEELRAEFPDRTEGEPYQPQYCGH